MVKRALVLFILGGLLSIPLGCPSSAPTGPAATPTVTSTHTVTATATHTMTSGATPVFTTSWTVPSVSRGMAVYGGKIYVGTNGGYILTFNLDGSSPVTFIDTFTAPRGVAADPTGNIYVADAGTHTVTKLNSLATPVATFGTGVSGNTTTQLNTPYGIAVDTDGYVYVADTTNSRIVKLNNDLTFNSQWNGSGSGSNFGLPYGVAVYGNSAVYVADSFGDRVVQGTTALAYVRQWGSPGADPGQFNFVSAIATDPSNGDVWVADSNGNRINRFSSTGTLLSYWGSQGTGDYQFAGVSFTDSPVGVTVDAAGNIYLVDKGNGLIKVFAP